MWHRRKVEMWTPPGKNRSSGCFYWRIIHFWHVRLTQKLLEAATRLRLRVLWGLLALPKPSSWCREEDIDSSPSSFYPPELLPQCFRDLISLYHTFCWHLRLCHTPSSPYQCVGRLPGTFLSRSTELLPLLNLTDIFDSERNTNFSFYELVVPWVRSLTEDVLQTVVESAEQSAAWSPGQKGKVSDVPVWNTDVNQEQRLPQHGKVPFPASRLRCRSHHS